MALFVAGTVDAQKLEKPGLLASRASVEVDQPQGTTAGPMSSDDRLLVMSAALGGPGSRSKPDCSHLVHQVYSRAGFPYPYASSSELYSGINEFQRVTTPQPADLIVWPGHMGIVVSPAQHSFYSSLRSGVGVDYYDSSYWRGRGKPRFYRYIKRTSMADTTKRDHSAEDSESEERGDSAKVIEPSNIPIIDALLVDSVRLSSNQIQTAFLKLSTDYGKFLDGRDLLSLRAPVIVFDKIKVGRIKVKSQEGSVDIGIDGPLSMADGRMEWKKHHDKRRWTISRRDQTTWQVWLPSAAVYLSRNDAVRLFAQQLAILSDHTHEENSGLEKKTELARALNILLGK
jgi:NlpC/P60 family protein